MNGRWIIYPETQFVSEERLLGWFRDAIANEEISYDGDPTFVHIDEVCEILADAGIVTFAKRDADEEALREKAHREAAELETETDPYGDDTPERPVF